MPAPRAIPVNRPFWKLAAVCAIAGMGVLTGLLLQKFAGAESSSRSIDWTAYDYLFCHRPVEDRQGGPIVLVVVDNWSLALMEKYPKKRFPWPRESYVSVIEAAEAGGARAVVFDVNFDEPSVYDRDFDDSKSLAIAAEKSKIPVIFGVQVSDNAYAPTPFALPMTNPRLGAVNVPPDQPVLRWYHLYLNGTPTLAMSVAMLLDPRLGKFARDEPFLLHYYGPFGLIDATDPTQRPTHRRYSFTDVVLPRIGYAGSDINPVDPRAFKDRIVVIGSVAHSLYDEKSSPRSDLFPGVDYQATAIENLLSGSHVHIASAPARLLALIIPCLIAATATIFLRRTLLKLGITGAVAAVLGSIVILLFRSTPIIFLPPVPPVGALGVSLLFGLAWSYVTEGRQRAFLSRAFSQYVSRDVVDELERNPSSLTLGGRRRTVTILFSDIRSFTTISEKMPTEQIEKFMNTYLGAMTDVVLGEKGTVDKYIGDAVMAFWNAPLDQADHPICAVKSAIRMLARECEMQSVLRDLTGEEIYTRIGVATGEVTVGNFGSEGKINYTVLGDSVNLASRLEGANKIYGSQILMAEPTALVAKESVLIRKLGLLRVKGKTQAMAVYEALAELPGTPTQQQRKACYEQAFDFYLARNWTRAEEILQSLISDHPEDRPAATLLSAVREFHAAPPADDWDGVYVAHEK